MKLDEVASGTVYVDTNVLYMYLRSDPVCLGIIKTFFQRMLKGTIEAYVGIPVMDELFYRLLLARVKDSTGGNPIDVLRQDPIGTTRKHSGAIAAALSKLISLPNIHLVGVDVTDFARMLENIRDFSLLPRDALHVAIYQRLGLSAIASDDQDFDRVVGLERHWVINPPELSSHLA